MWQVSRKVPKKFCTVRTWTVSKKNHILESAAEEGKPLLTLIQRAPPPTQNSWSPLVRATCWISSLPGHIKPENLSIQLHQAHIWVYHLAPPGKEKKREKIREYKKRHRLQGQQKEESVHTWPVKWSCGLACSWSTAACVWLELEEKAQDWRHVWGALR